MIRDINEIIQQKYLNICKLKNTVSIKYRIKDYNDEIIEGIFYEKELVGYNKEDEVYKVEKIIRKTKIFDTYKYLVKWQGYPEFINSWVDKTN